MLDAKQPKTAQSIFSSGVLPIALGVGFGALASYDSTLSHMHPLRRLGIHAYHSFPFLWSLSLVVLLACLYMTVTRIEWLHARRHAIAALVLVVPVSLAGINLGPLDPTDFGVLFVFVFWVAVSLVEHRPVVTPLPILFMLSGLTFFVLASTINGLETSIRGLHSPLAKLAVLFLMTNIVVDVSQHRIAVRALVAIAVFSAIVGIASQVVYRTTGFALTMDDLPEFQFKDTPLGRMVRATAFMPRTQVYGHLLIIGMSLVLFIQMKLKRRLILIALLGTGAASTFSVGTFLAMSVVLLLSIFIRHPHRTLHYLTCGATTVLLAYYCGALEWIYREVFLPLGGTGFKYRLEYLRVGMKAVEDHPLVGIGVRNIGRYLYTLIHNSYLQLAADIGIIGGGIFIIMLAYLSVGSALLIRMARTERTKNLLKGVFLGMIGLSVHFLTEPLYDNIGSWMFLGLVASTIVIYSDGDPELEDDDAETT